MSCSVGGTALFTLSADELLDLSWAAAEGIVAGCSMSSSASTRPSCCRKLDVVAQLELHLSVMFAAGGKWGRGGHKIDDEGILRSMVSEVSP